MSISSRLTRVLCAAALLLASFVATAQRVEGDRAKAEGLFAAEIAVNNQSEAQRDNAFARGLLQVLTRITGDAAVASRPGVSQELRRARDYVAGYDYRQDEGVSATGAPSFRTIVVTRFDQDRVEDLVATLALPVWPQPRPKPVLWLGIDDGRGPRLVGLPQSAAARSVLDRAVERGYRLGLPTGTAAEQAVVGAIWRGDVAAVARASSRYSPPMQLIGKLYRDGSGGWTADWIFVDGGRQLAKWSSSDRDARRAMAAGADGAADALVKRYAKAAEGAGEAGSYQVTFTGLAGSDDYIRLAAYLQKQAVVRRIVPISAAPDAVVLELELVSGLEGFRRATADDDVIVADEGAAPAVYRLR